jgi:hypothetical protein
LDHGPWTIDPYGSILQQTNKQTTTTQSMIQEPKIQNTNLRRHLSISRPMPMMMTHSPLVVPHLTSPHLTGRSLSLQLLLATPNNKSLPIAPVRVSGFDPKGNFGTDTVHGHEPDPDPFPCRACH